MWLYSLELKEILKQYGEKSFEDVRDESTKLLEYFKNSHFNSDDKLEEIIENLQSAEDVNEFDDALEELYDWADERRVWLGL